MNRNGHFVKHLLQDRNSLSDSDFDEISRHIESCEECRNEFEREERFRSKLNAVRPLETPLDAGDSRVVFQSIASKIDRQAAFPLFSKKAILIGAFAFGACGLMLALTRTPKPRSANRDSREIARLTSHPTTSLPTLQREKVVEGLPVQLNFSENQTQRADIKHASNPVRITFHPKKRPPRKAAKTELAQNASAPETLERVSNASTTQRISSVAEAFYLARKTDGESSLAITKNDESLAPALLRLANGQANSETSLARKPVCNVEVTFAPDDPDPVDFSQSVCSRYLGGGQSVLLKDEKTIRANYVYESSEFHTFRFGKMTNSLTISASLPALSSKEKNQ